MEKPTGRRRGGTIEKITGLPPFDKISKHKAIINYIRFSTLFIILLGFSAFFIYNDITHPYTSVTTYREVPFRLPNITICIEMLMTQFQDEVYYDLFLEPEDSTVFFLPGNARDTAVEAHSFMEPVFTSYTPENKAGSVACYQLSLPADSSWFNVSSTRDAWQIYIEWDYMKGANWQKYASYPAQFTQLAYISFYGTETPSDMVGSINYAPATYFSAVTVGKSKNVTEDQTIELFSTSLTPIFNMSTSEFPCSEPSLHRPANNTDGNCVEGYLKLQLSVQDFTVLSTIYETKWGLAKRIIADIGSLISFVGVMTGIIFTVLITRVFFHKGPKTAFIPHEIRESVLHILKEYPTHRQTELPERRQEKKEESIEIYIEKDIRDSSNTLTTIGESIELKVSAADLPST